MPTITESNPRSPVRMPMPESTERLIVTIDGPAGTGKSSVSRELASRLGLEFLDTGAMYRAAAALAIEAGLTQDPLEVIEDQIARVVREADLRFDFQDDPPTLLARDASIMGRLRDPDVGALVSPVSQLPEIRRILVERQRRIAEAHPRLVTEGRDQGSVVFPEASVKLYLDADLDVRARRRLEQLEAGGAEASIADVRAEIAQRDERDANRAVGPLRCPEDAIRVDTSRMTQGQVIDRLVEIVGGRIDSLTSAS